MEELEPVELGSGKRRLEFTRFRISIFHTIFIFPFGISRLWLSTHLLVYNILESLDNPKLHTRFPPLLCLQNVHFRKCLLHIPNIPR